MAWIHRLSNVDSATLIGDCENCGPSVRLMYDKAGQRIRCWLGRQKGGTYGNHRLSYAEKVVLFGSQTSCPICKRGLSYEESHLDHDHETGELRGFLCTHCNLGLGKFGDNVEGLEAAVRYLKNPPLQNNE